MNNRQLSQILILLIVGMAAGFLLLLFRSPAPVVVERRLTDYAAERRAGTLRESLSEEARERQPVRETLDIRGELLSFGGQPGDTRGEWSRFRGADFSNRAADGPPILEQWPNAGPPVVWRVKLGEGYAGPAVREGRVFVLDYDVAKEGDALRCFSLADGQEVWRRTYRAPIKKNHGFSRTVPAVTDDFVVTLGPRCIAMCVRPATGEFVWGIDLVADQGTEVPLWYTGQCPLIDDGIAVLAPGGKVLLMGVECATGKVVWQTPNPDRWNMSHSSVVPATLLGRKMYVYCAKEGTVGVSAETGDRGKVLWKTTAWAHSVTSPSPLPIDDRRLFLTAGYGGGSMMLGLQEENGQLIARPLFELEKSVFSCEQHTPLLHREHLFAVLPKDAGEFRAQFACLNLDGKVVWTSGKTERFGLGPFLLAGDKMFILSDDGTLTLIRASTTGYEQLARARVLHGREAWAPMAMVDGRLLLRDFEELICLDVRAQQQITANRATIGEERSESRRTEPVGFGDSRTAGRWEGAFPLTPALSLGEKVLLASALEVFKPLELWSGSARSGHRRRPPMFATALENRGGGFNVPFSPRERAGVRGRGAYFIKPASKSTKAFEARSPERPTPTSTQFDIPMMRGASLTVK